MLDDDQFQELLSSYPDVVIMTEGDKNYIFFPQLIVKAAGKKHVVKGLLCPSEHSGYQTKLFLSSQIPGTALNWNFTNRILDSTWFSWSWQGVSASNRLLQILAGHLEAFR